MLRDDGGLQTEARGSVSGKREWLKRSQGHTGETVSAVWRPCRQGLSSAGQEATGGPKNRCLRRGGGQQFPGKYLGRRATHPRPVSRCPPAFLPRPRFLIGHQIYRLGKCSPLGRPQSRFQALSRRKRLQVLPAPPHVQTRALQAGAAPFRPDSQRQPRIPPFCHRGCCVLFPAPSARQEEGG